MWPFLFLLLGPPLVPVWVAGLLGLARRPGWRPIRFLAAAFPVLLALVFLMGAQPYYLYGLVAVLFAVGCVPAQEWISRGTAPASSPGENCRPCTRRFRRERSRAV